MMFADANIAHDAWHRDGEGQFTRIRIIPRRADTDVVFGAGRLWSEAFRFDVQVAELPNPRPQDQILLGDETFLIEGEPMRDRDRLIWTIEATPA